MKCDYCWALPHQDYRADFLLLLSRVAFGGVFYQIGVGSLGQYFSILVSVPIAIEAFPLVDLLSGTGEEGDLHGEDAFHADGEAVVRFAGGTESVGSVDEVAVELEHNGGGVLAAVVVDHHQPYAYAVVVDGVDVVERLAGAQAVGESPYA